MYCIFCGQPNPEKARFCNNFGRELPVMVETLEENPTAESEFVEQPLKI